MEKSLNKEILDKIDEIVEFVKDSKEYQQYLFLEQKMKEHPKIPKLISEIKKLQKKAVKASNKEEVSIIDEEILTIQNELEDIPLYVDFLRVQSELNVTFSIIKETIDKIFEF